MTIDRSDGYDLFIAHARVDAEAAKGLTTALRELGHRVFLDSDLAPGADWTTEIPAAQSRSRATVLLVSEAGKSRGFYQHAEMKTAIQLRREGAHEVALVLLDGTHAEDAAYGGNVLPLLASEGGHDADAAHLSRWLAGELDPTEWPQPPPRWAAPTYGRALLPFLLLGSVDTERSADREAAGLVGSPWDELEPVLSRLRVWDDAPIVREGTRWSWRDRVSAWSYLGRYLAPEHVGMLGDLVQRVLGEADPRAELPPEERALASGLGVHLQHSDQLRRGVAEACRLLSQYDPGGRDVGLLGRAHASGWLRSLLETGEGARSRWASLGNELLPLAEAAPDAFLELLDRDMDVAAQLFEPTGTSSPHHELLWALEALAWDPRRLGYAVLLLARLAALDPGGETVNRPSESLLSILNPYLPNTSASAEERWAALLAVQRVAPDILFELVLESLPQHQRMFARTHSPSRSNAEPVRQPAETIDAEVARLLDLALELADGAKRWTSLVSRMHDSWNPARIVECLKQQDLPDDADRAELWDALRRVLSTHRQFADADWTFDDAVIDALQERYDAYTPSDPALRLAWRFGSNPAHPGGEGDYSTLEAWLRTLRLEGAAEVVALDGWTSELDRLAPKVEKPFSLGWALANLERSDVDEVIFVRGFPYCDGRLWQGYFQRRSGDRSWLPGAIERLIARGRTDDLDLAMQTLHLDPALWPIIDDLGPDVAAAYWRNVQAVGQLEAGQVDLAAHRLAASGSSQAALAVLGQAARRGVVVRGPTVITVFESLDQSVPLGSGVSHWVLPLLDVLRADPAVTDDAAVAWSWAFAPAFPRSLPDSLRDRLTTHPDFFVELVCLVFRRANSEPEELDQQQRARARAAYGLMHRWGDVPGRVGDTFDPAALEAWILAVRAGCRAADREAIGDLQIGQVVARTPLGEDGAWPAEGVRDLIERHWSAELSRGIHTGRMNAIGVTVRPVGEGGEQERKRAEQYRSWADASLAWPRTANLLRQLAMSFELSAQRADRLD